MESLLLGRNTEKEFTRLGILLSIESIVHEIDLIEYDVSVSSVKANSERLEIKPYKKRNDESFLFPVIVNVEKNEYGFWEIIFSWSSSGSPKQCSLSVLYPSGGIVFGWEEKCFSMLKECLLESCMVD